MAKVWIGTTGYGYQEWKGKFYPSDLPDQEMLAYYAQRFPTVELNQTSHRMPNVRTLQGWAKETGPDFTFSLKAPRRITHDLRLRDAGDALTNFCETARVLKGKLGAMLFQLPPFLKNDAARLEDFLHQFPPGYRAAFEFRHPSWFTDEVFDCLRRFDAAVCVAEFDERSAPFERTAPFGYLRLRRREYTDEELEAWARRLTDPSLGWTDVFIYFKHEAGGKGPQLAARLQALIEPSVSSPASGPD